MEKYSYIIIGIIALVFNIYRKAQKKKKEAEMAMQMQEQQKMQRQQQTQEQQQAKPKETFPTDFLEDFDKHFGNTEDNYSNNIEDDYIPKIVINEKTYNIPDLNNLLQKGKEEDQEEFEQKIEEYNIDNKLIIKPKTITKNNVKINLKQAIIYSTILEKKY